MKRILISVLAVAFIMAGCASKSGLAPAAGYDQSFGYGGGAPSYPQEMPLPAATGMPAEAYARTADGIAANTNAVTTERMVIKNADLTLVVDDPEASMGDISTMAEAMGGFVVSSNVYKAYSSASGRNVPEASVVIRVPAEKLDEALKAIKAGSVEVQGETVSGEDVTAQYVDLQSQLKNLEAAEAQLTKIMQDAIDTEDVLNVYNQLVSIRGQIESIKGQMKYYEESAALSSVSVRLVAQETVQNLGPWEPGTTAGEAVRNLLEFWRDFVDFLIYLVLNFIPKLLSIGLVFGLPIWLIVRAVRKSRRKSKDAALEKAETK